MMMGGFTPDEKFLIALYTITQAQDDPEVPVDSHLVGKSVGMKERQVDAICILLLRANFIKRTDKHSISLTPNGERLVKNLLDS